MHSVFGLLIRPRLFDPVRLGPHRAGSLPIPSVPLMLAAGTMSAAHKLHLAYAIRSILLACLISDSAGRSSATISAVACSISSAAVSLEAATCVERTHGTVGKRGAFTLLSARFVYRPQHRGRPHRRPAPGPVHHLRHVRHGRVADLVRCLAPRRTLLR